jgi:hypothetical protein
MKTEQLQTICNHLDSLRVYATKSFEQWDSIVYQGDYCDVLCRKVIECLEALDTYGCPEVCSVWFDSDLLVNLDDLKATEKGGRKPSEWSLSFNKNSLINGDIFGEPDIKQVLFCNIEAFKTWANEINPFSLDNNLFHSGRPVKVLVNGLSHAFGGPRIAVCPLAPPTLPELWLGSHKLPSDEELRTHIHVAANFNMRLEPSSFLLNWGCIDQEEADPFRRLCAITLSACLVQDFFDINHVVLNGAKRRSIPLVKSVDIPPTSKQLESLCQTIEWGFAENPETRILLIVDRLSLDVPEGDSFVHGIESRIKEALDHAKNKYRFVVLKRKDEHCKELTNIQKELRSLSDLYSQKVRSLLNGLLRDFLAALLLVSIGLFAKFIKDISVLLSPEAGILFKGLGVYFLFSIILQAWIHWKDLRVSENEMNFWTSDLTRNYMSLGELKELTEGSIKERRDSCYRQAAFITAMYLIIGLFALNLQTILRHWIINPHQVRESQTNFPTTDENKNSITTKVFSASAGLTDVKSFIPSIINDEPTYWFCPTTLGEGREICTLSLFYVSSLDTSLNWYPALLNHCNSMVDPIEPRLTWQPSPGQFASSCPLPIWSFSNLTLFPQE